MQSHAHTITLTTAEVDAVLDALSEMAERARAAGEDCTALNELQDRIEYLPTEA